MIKPECIATSRETSGFRIVRRCGTAFGEATRTHNLLRDAMRSIGTILGIAPYDFVTDAERARADSIARLLERAERMGANGVIGVRFHAVDEAGATRLMAVGEAVVLDPEPR
ncbi:MAG TPA: heavy metal-binding domain-containing protein [Candidatus Dormibacteraeota bacterium]|nr:heavy metal-binding domain-containing protein [Candidatus Dormibacteraeota bacterium]